MVLGYVCTNFKNSAYTCSAVSSLLRNSDHEYRVVVVDNNSDIENVRLLENLANACENVELILSRENVGYFGGLNLGIRRLRAESPEAAVMVVGNNDLVFPADFADAVQRNLQIFEKYPVVAPDIVTLDGVHQNPHIIDGISRFREFVYDLYYTNYYLGMVLQKLADCSRSLTARTDQSQHDVRREIHSGLGACYLLGPVFFRYFEELWAPTFLVHEEFFLSKQLNDRDLRIYYEPSIRVLHHFQVSMKTLGSRKTWEFSREAHRVRRQYVKVFN